MAHDHDHDVTDDDLDFEDIDIKEALGLPDALPPIRLLPLSVLAAQARNSAIPAQLAALAGWVGKDGRDVTEDGEPTPEDLTAVTAAIGVDEDDFGFLWEYALAVEWLVFDEGDEDRVEPGETADDWIAGDDEQVVAAWASTFAAVLGETLLLYGPDLAETDDDEEEEELDFDFAGQGMAIAVLLYLARREGLTAEEFAEVLWENAAGGHDDDDEEAHEEIAAARAEWESAYGDAAGLLLDKLKATRAIVIEDGDLVRLSPLALAALRDQLVEAGVDIPLLPQTAAELSGAELLAMAAGVGDAEWEAEADAWITARGTGAAARELLELAAEADPGERMLAVAAATRIGPPAEPAWRANLAVPQVRAYAKVALAQLVGLDADGDLPPELEMTPDDLAWVATDLLALTVDEEFPDSGELEVSFREAVPAGREQQLFEGMGRSTHPEGVRVLSYLGEYHPDEQIAKAARTAALKAATRR